MAIISQVTLFDNTEIYDNLGDLERVKFILDNIPDEPIVKTLEKKVKKAGRKGADVRVLLNIYWMRMILQHKSMQSALRELSRNSQLRKLCGIFNENVPSDSAISRFEIKLNKYTSVVKEVFYEIRDEFARLDEAYGRELGADGKYIDSYAKSKSENPEKDGRRETDAKYGIKQKFSKDAKGNEVIKTEFHFGFKVHILGDVNYELPFDFTVTTANKNEGKELDKMLDKKQNEILLKRADSLVADRGYDSKARIESLEERGINAIIDARILRKEEQLISENVYFDDTGNVYCYCPKTAVKREMAKEGYERSRDALVYKCPAKAYGITCKGACDCSVKTKLRIKRRVDVRIFTKVQRKSYKWKKKYKKRTAIERINSRIDMGYEFENHNMRGKPKVETRVSMTMVMMMSIALINLKLGKKDKLRSLVNCA